jgi:hypothetical protein
MAQNRKAKTAKERQELIDATNFAAERCRTAKESYQESPSLKRLRDLQVAKDELAALELERQTFDDDRDPAAVRRADAHPRRNHGSWPVGKPYNPHERSKPAPVPKENKKPPLAPPPAPRPAILQPKIVAAAVAGRPKERVSWWVGADRATLDDGAAVLAKTPPTKTSAASSVKQIKQVQARVNDEKRYDKTFRETVGGQSKTEKLSAKLQEKLKPMSGAFSVIPQVE